VSPLELFSALQSNGGVSNTIVYLYDIDCQFIEQLENKYKQSFEFFKTLRRCNEVKFRDNTLLVYQYSNTTPTNINLSDSFNPTTSTPTDDESRVHIPNESDTEIESETEVIYDDGEDINEGSIVDY